MTPSPALAQGFSNIGHSYAHILTMLFPTVVIALESSWGLSYGDLLALMIAGQVLFGAGALPSGWIGDRWSAVGMMIVYFIGTGVATVMTGFARSPLEVALGLAAIGIFASIYHPVGMAWLIRNAVNRGKALGTNGVFGAVGVALGPAIAGILTDTLSWRWAFIIPGATAVVVGVALWACRLRGLVADTKADLKPQPEPGRQAVVRAFFILSLTMICTGLISNSLMVILPKLFVERTGATIAGAGAMVTVVYLFAAAAQYVGGWLADRHAMKQVYALSFMIQAPILFVAAMLDSWVLLTAAIVMVFVNVGALPSENGMVAYFTPGKWRGTAYGAKFVLSIGVSAMAIPLAGRIHDATGGFFWLFMVLGTLAAIVAAAAIWLPNDKTAPAPAEAPPMAPIRAAAE